MTAKVGQAEAGEQVHKYRVHPDSHGAAPYPPPAVHRNALLCTNPHSFSNSLELRAADLPLRSRVAT